ncbi:MAG: exosortase C-terminal domain/associated protein EpsI [Acidobacteriaceae bacterium]|jgi:EpsI family protein
MKSPKLWLVVILMSFTALVLHVRGDVDRVPVSTPLAQFPPTIDGRTSIDIPLDEEVLQILGKGFFLNRLYLAPTGVTPANPGDRASIGLFIGYFPTQRTGQSIHSPQNCLPGAGWTFESSGVTDLTGPNGQTSTVGEYLITNGGASEEVLYWYQMQGRTIANDYKAKLYTLADSIRYGRTDAALVRVVTPLAPGEDRSKAHTRVVDFAEQFSPLLPAYIPN